jgi:hypothetical protein
MTPIDLPIAEDTLNLPVAGRNLAPGPLRAQLVAEGPTLLVFLRHFG